MLPGDNTVVKDPLDQWAHFFRRAGFSSPKDLFRKLPDAVFVEATGVLEMIARNPEEKRLYEARLKFQRDEQARLEYAIEEGEIKGKIKGKIEGKIEGKITAFQEILELPLSKPEELAAMTPEELASLTSELQQLIRNRFS